MESMKLYTLESLSFYSHLVHTRGAQMVTKYIMNWVVKLGSSAAHTKDS